MSQTVCHAVSHMVRQSVSQSVCHMVVVAGPDGELLVKYNIHPKVLLSRVLARLPINTIVCFAE